MNERCPGYVGNTRCRRPAHMTKAEHPNAARRLVEHCVLFGCPDHPAHPSLVEETS